MRYNEVYAIGEKVGNHTFTFIDFLSNFTWWQYLIYISIISLLVLIGVIYEHVFGLTFITFLIAGIMCSILPFANFIYNDIKTTDLNNEEINNYKEEYAYPLIDELPITTREVIYIKVDNEMEVTGKFNRGYGEINSNMITVYNIMYVDNGEVKTATIEATTHVSTSDDIKPTIHYKELKANLPYVEKGMYDVLLNLPSNYEFTDIK